MIGLLDIVLGPLDSIIIRFLSDKLSSGSYSMYHMFAYLLLCIKLLDYLGHTMLQMKWYQRCWTTRKPSIWFVQESHENNMLPHQKHMTVEFASCSDGREAVVKAANALFMKYLKSGANGQNQEEQIFTESQMREALKIVGLCYLSDLLDGCYNSFLYFVITWLGFWSSFLLGSGGPDPDLLLVYGPARCHLGFPAWRIRYTEIVWVFRWLKFFAIGENTLFCSL